MIIIISIVQRENKGSQNLENIHQILPRCAASKSRAEIQIQTCLFFILIFFNGGGDLRKSLIQPVHTTQTLLCHPLLYLFALVIRSPYSNFCPQTRVPAGHRP